MTLASNILGFVGTFEEVLHCNLLSEEVQPQRTPLRSLVLRAFTQLHPLHLNAAKSFPSFPALPTLISYILLTPQLLQHLSTECEFPSAHRYQHVSVDCVRNIGALGKRQTECCLVTDTIFPQFQGHQILSIAQ